MLGCRDCKNAIFHEQRGEYKCTVRKTYVKVEPNLRCKDWELGKPGKSKRDEKED